MGGIFISYRRDDSAYIAGRLRDDLAEQFGDAFVVFRDIETMPLGPFPEQLAAAIADADAVLVVIGDGWLGPRLHAPQDWVRREIAAALEQKKVAGRVRTPLWGSPLVALTSIQEEAADMRRSQLVVIIAVGGVLALAVVVALVVVVGGGSDEDASPSRPTAPPLTGPARDYVQLTQQGAAQAYSATYELIDDGAPGTVETERVWRGGDQLRIARETRPADGPPVRSQTFVGRGRVIGCSQTGDEPWSCAPAPNVTPDAYQLFGLPTASELAVVGVTSSEARIGGEAGRCFTLGSGAASSEICLSADGIPLRMTAGPTGREVRELRREAPAPAVFTLPAPPG